MTMKQVKMRPIAKRKRNQDFLEQSSLLNSNSLKKYYTSCVVFASELIIHNDGVRHGIFN